MLMPIKICINIVDGPHNLDVLQPNSAVLKTGDRLACKAEGSPSPDYLWTDAVTGQSLQRGLTRRDTDFGLIIRDGLVMAISIG